MTADRLVRTHCGLAAHRFHCLVLLAQALDGSRAAETSGGYQEAMILVKGGYTPDTIIVRAGRPVRLNFRREETASCSDKVIFADFDKSAELADGRDRRRRTDAQGTRRVYVCLPDGHVSRTAHC